MKLKIIMVIMLAQAVPIICASSGKIMQAEIGMDQEERF